MLPFTNKKTYFVFFLVVLSMNVMAVDFWQYPEASDKDAIFAGVFAASFTFDFNDLSNSRFGTEYPLFYIDYILPVGLPFSIGASVDPLQADYYGMGLRPGYHVNFNVPNLDVYVMYSLDFEFFKTSIVLDHGVRLGLRYIMFGLFCLNIETGYRFENVVFGLSIKLH